MKRIISICSLLFILFGFPGCSDDEDKKTAFIDDSPNLVYENVSELITNDSRLDSLEKAILHADLFRNLQNKGPFSVLAPTNEAFVQLLDSNSNWNQVSDIDSSLLRKVIRYHIIGDLIASSHIEENTYATSLNSQGANNEATSLEFDIHSGIQINNSATVTSPDHVASNGVIHMIDQVLSPQSVLQLLENDERFTSFLFPMSNGLKDSLAGLDSTAGKIPFTLFVPSDSAFIRLIQTDTSWNTLSDIPQLSSKVNYHIIANSNIQSSQLKKGQIFPSLNSNSFQLDSNNTQLLISSDTNQAKVLILETNIQGTNGVIHLIKDVLRD